MKAGSQVLGRAWDTMLRIARRKTLHETLTKYDSESKKSKNRRYWALANAAYESRTNNIRRKISASNVTRRLSSVNTGAGWAYAKNPQIPESPTPAKSSK
jgi:hypothetical protein